MAQLEAYLLFLFVPLGAFVVAAASSVSVYADVRAENSQKGPPLPPNPLGRFLLIPAILVTPVIFGFILWALSLPFVAELEASVSPDVARVARLHLWSGIAFAWAAFVTIASQAWVARRRIRQALGEEFGRVLPLIVIPETLSILALILVFLILGIIVDVIDVGATLSPSGVEATILGLQVFAVSTLATPVGIAVSNRVTELDSRGFLRALIPMEIGVVATIAALAWAFLQVGSLAA